jgi:hypothetical protein
MAQDTVRVENVFLESPPLSGGPNTHRNIALFVWALYYRHINTSLNNPLI